MESEVKIANNKTLLRFEILLDNESAILNYRFHKDNLAVIHTSVPLSMRGKGIGSKLVLAAIQYAKDEHKKLILYCPFAAQYIKEHPELHQHIDIGFHTFLKKTS